MRSEWKPAWLWLAPWVAGLVLLAVLYLAHSLALAGAFLGDQSEVVDAVGFEPPSAGPLGAPLGVARYVAANGTDSGTCMSKGSPCATPQYAVDQSTSGDHVLISAGTYSGVSARGGASQAVYIDKDIMVRGGYAVGFGAWDPWVFVAVLDAQGAGRGIVVNGAVNVTIEGVKVTNGNASGMGNNGGGVRIYGATVALSGTQVISNSTTGVRGRGHRAAGYGPVAPCSP